MTLHDIWQRDHAGDFAAGVALLVQHNPNAVAKAILARLQTLAATGAYVGNYEQGKLAYALQGSLASAQTPDARQGDAMRKTKDQSLKTAHEPPPPTQPDPKLTSEKAIALHKEHAHVHALMVAAATDDERAKYARDIMQRIIPALDAEYDRLRAAQSGAPIQVDNTGLAPILTTSTAADYKKLQSVRSRISTLKGKIKKETDPKKKAKWERELETKIAERERLEEKLQ